MSTDVKDLLVKRIQELEAEIQPMRDSIAAAEEEIERSKAALAALEGHLPTRSMRTPRATAKASSNGRTTRGSRPDETSILSHIGNDWTKSTDIAKAMDWNGSAQALRDVLNEMVEGGKLKTEGQRAGKKYALAKS